MDKERSKHYPLRRREVVAELLKDRDEMLVVAGLGACAWDVTAAGDHPSNFPLWGAMGGAVAIGLVEAGLDPGVEEPRFYVSNVLRPLVRAYINGDERKAACAAAARSLYEEWGFATAATETPDDDET